MVLPRARCPETSSGRVPVVAAGSNAAPTVLFRKLGGLLEARLPVGTAVVDGLHIGHSAHVSARGYVAAAPARGGAAQPVTVCWFDAAQLAELDATEPNYRRVDLPRSMPCHLSMARGAPAVVVQGAQAYESVHGVLGETDPPVGLLEQSAILALTKAAALTGDTRGRYPHAMRSRWQSSLTTVLVALLAVAGTVGALAWRPSLNPFQEETVDRTGPSVLQSLTDISEFHAATGHYETLVDIEKDTQYLPDWVSGERVLYLGKGDVDGVVDFSELDERSITLSEDGTSVTIILPAPTVGEPVLDLKNSYVVNHDQGITNRFKGSELEREAQLKAVEQMTTAASGEGMLVDLSKENTTSMLRGLLGALAYSDITITFEDDSR